MDPLSSALHILAGDVCLRVGPAEVLNCRPFTAITAITATPGTAPTCPEALSTWLCKGGTFFSLFKSNTGTLLFSHTNEVLYHASIDAQLSPTCPVGLCFLCQFTTDSTPDGDVSRLLAFDILSESESPSARGEVLRGAQSHLPHPLCCVQWVGPRRYLSREFIAGLPHQIEGLISIGPDPLVGGLIQLNT
jgi:hypothetical protein